MWSRPIAIACCLALVLIIIHRIIARWRARQFAEEKAEIDAYDQLVKDKGAAALRNALQQLQDTESVKTSGALATQTAITVAQIQVSRADETRHFGLLGEPKSGKSTAIREIVAAALKRRDRLIIYDPKGEYLSRFYCQSRGDIVLNPFDARSHRWDLRTDIVHTDELSALTRAFDVWRHRNGHSPAQLVSIALCESIIRRQATDTKSTTDLSPSELAASVESVLRLSASNESKMPATDAIGGLPYLSEALRAMNQSTAPAIAVRDWTRLATDGALFLSGRDTSTAEALTATWLLLAALEAAHSHAGIDQSLWLIVDDPRDGYVLETLVQYLSPLSASGVRCVLSTKLSRTDLVAPSACVQNIFRHCGNLVIMDGTALRSAELIQELGQSIQIDTLLSASAAASAGLTFDLNGHLKLASEQDWKAFCIPIWDQLPRAEPFLARQPM